MRTKNKKFLGMPIPERELSREELENMSQEDLEALGTETRFSHWYFQTVWGAGRFIVAIALLMFGSNYLSAWISGEAIEFDSSIRTPVILIFLAFAAPLIFLTIAAAFWYVPNFWKKLLAKIA